MLFTLFQGLVFVNTAVHSGISLGILVVMLMSVFLFLLLQTDFYSQLLQALAVLVIALVLINLPGLFLRSGDENEMFFISGKNGLSIFPISPARFSSCFRRSSDTENSAGRAPSGWGCACSR